MSDKSSQKEPVALDNARVPHDLPEFFRFKAVALNGRIPPETPVAMASNLGSQKEDQRGQGGESRQTHRDALKSGDKMDTAMKGIQMNENENRIVKNTGRVPQSPPRTIVRPQPIRQERGRVPPTTPKLPTQAPQPRRK